MPWLTNIITYNKKWKPRVFHIDIISYTYICHHENEKCHFGGSDALVDEFLYFDTRFKCFCERWHFLQQLLGCTVWLWWLHLVFWELQHQKKSRNKLFMSNWNGNLMVIYIYIYIYLDIYIIYPQIHSLVDTCQYFHNQVPIYINNLHMSNIDQHTEADSLLSHLYLYPEA